MPLVSRHVKGGSGSLRRSTECEMFRIRYAILFWDTRAFVDISKAGGCMKKRLMIFCDAYLPGKNGGGGMWAVKNLAERFSDRYEFFIVTRDCDSRTDNTPYVQIARNKWTERPEARVYYASPSHLKPRKLKELVENVEPD